jgi:hypothetical protein
MRNNMRNSVGPTIVPIILVGLWFLVSAAISEIPEQPRRPHEEMDKRDFPCSESWRQFPLARNRIFRSLGLTTEQREEVGRLRKQFRDSLLDLKHRHNESLLNVLDDNQRRKLEEKKGEIDRFLRERIPPGEREYDPQPDVGFKEDQEPADSWESFMVEVDSNNNGVLDEEDFEAAQARGDEDLPPSWVSAAQEFDANGDGVIDQREYRQVFKSYQEESSAVRPEPQKEDITAGQTSENFKETGVSVNTWGIIKRGFIE